MHRAGTCSQKSNNNGSYRYTSAPSADTAVYVCVYQDDHHHHHHHVGNNDYGMYIIHMAQQHHMPMLILMLMLMLTRGLVLPEV